MAARIAAKTYCCRKQHYGVLQISEAKKLTGLEDENRRLKKLVAD